MVGCDVERTITTHSILVTRTEWELNGNAAIETFREGLIKPLHLVVLNKDKLPDTLNGWQRATRRKHAKYALKKASNLLREGKKVMQKLFTNKLKKCKRDSDTMDVNNTRLSLLTKQEEKGS
jgi:hypothetical protein